MIRIPLLTLILFNSTLAADNGEVERARKWSPAERSVIDTLRLLRQKDRPLNEELAPRMYQWASMNKALLFEILEERLVPTYDEDPAQILSIYQEDLILMTVGMMQRSKVKRFLRSRDEELDVNGRRATIDFLGAAGNSADFPDIFSLAWVGEESDLPSKLGPAVRRAVGTILRQHEGFRDLMPANGNLPEGFIREIVMAIGDVGDPRGLPFLEEALDWNSHLVAEILSQINKVGYGTDAEVNEDVRDKVREYFDSGKPMVCRAACLASAALDDLEAVSDLIGLLDSETQGLRANAHWALQRITRMRMSPSHNNWQRWYEGELTWTRKYKLIAFSKLSSNNPGQIARAIADVAVHPLVREDFNEALCGLTGSRFPQIRILVVEELAELGFASARIFIEDACKDAVDEVASAAEVALERFEM